jgi:hypothetical protein
VASDRIRGREGGDLGQEAVDRPGPRVELTTGTAGRGGRGRRGRESEEVAVDLRRERAAGQTGGG